MTFIDASLCVCGLTPFTVHCEENTVKTKVQYNNKVPSGSIVTLKRQVFHLKLRINNV